ncbi:GNAT family N-acetyltransferase [Caulobacter sp. BK020]|uniref:GNAT family N-acetyltransferase n=1 Tax=Caulobacter sp. BK020 TaxID=2512117 RepID=UPI0010EBF9E1|nr:GNAT family N-acetyltransferase [Caulobacter sp. BK020]TCS14892.1 acetyltransferase (GNAT) family protein [Caulobacter sp. BK020]
MTILFYRRDGGGAGLATLPSGLVFRIWSPGDQGPPPAGSQRASNWTWWLFETLGLFSRPGFREVTIWRDGQLVHRLILTPRWPRFPFMDAYDLQVGDIWTHPGVRGQGLARLALTAVQALTWPEERLWYLVEANNAASVRLAETAGYRLFGSGRRTRPLGLATLGRFRLDAPIAR